LKRRVKIRSFLGGTERSHSRMGPALIRHVEDMDKGDKFHFKQEKSKKQKKGKARGKEAILMKAGVAGLLMRTKKKDPQVGKK
jgi:hypothetical protein